MTMPLPMTMAMPKTMRHYYDYNKTEKRGWALDGNCKFVSNEVKILRFLSHERPLNGNSNKLTLHLNKIMETARNWNRCCCCFFFGKCVRL